MPLKMETMPPTVMPRATRLPRMELLLAPIRRTTLLARGSVVSSRTSSRN
jgi:hypothetical protein